MAEEGLGGAPSARPKKLRVLVVDDSRTSRLAIVSAMNQIPFIQVSGAVATIAEALEKIEELKPEIVSIDKQLDGEDGIDLIEIVYDRYPNIVPLLVTAMTKELVGPSLERLADRPVEFLAKPGRGMRFDEWVKGPLLSTLERVRHSVPGRTLSSLGRRATPLPTSMKRTSCPDLILVGSSTGGPAAVRTFLENVPDDCTAPIVITQHMPPVFTGVFADQLDRRLKRSVFEAKQGDLLRPGGVWISPGDFHLTLSREGSTWRTHLDDRPHLHGCRPAVDHLFSSVADEITPGGGLITVVVLTGMGQDGCAGAARIKKAGGSYVRILAQNKATSAVWGMPAAIVDAGLAEGTGSPEQLGEMVKFEYISKRRSR